MPHWQAIYKAGQLVVTLNLMQPHIHTPCTDKEIYSVLHSQREWQQFVPPHCTVHSIFPKNSLKYIVRDPTYWQWIVKFIRVPGSSESLTKSRTTAGRDIVTSCSKPSSILGGFGLTSLLFTFQGGLKPSEGQSLLAVNCVLVSARALENIHHWGLCRQPLKCIKRLGTQKETFLMAIGGSNMSLSSPLAGQVDH